jgi:AraC family transcriptional regulator of adaptative response / DNA-3-methyladenine glycosylase II
MTATTVTESLDDTQKYERILASDAAWDGRFYVGVTTTGIYCRPSCRVRKPLRKNVRFYTTTEEARAAGLRPCRRCHPDDFANGEDIDRDEVLALVAEVEANPEGFADVEAVVDRSGYGATRLFETFRRVLGVTPAAVLNAARIEHAKRLLRESDESVLGVALASGFHSASAFHRRFKLATGMTPLAYRETPTAGPLPAGGEGQSERKDA